jgi:outer membrane protein assembly factor BamB
MAGLSQLKREAMVCLRPVPDRLARLALPALAGVSFCSIVAAAASINATPPMEGVGLHDWPQWGGTVQRNMVSAEQGLPETFDAGLDGHARKNIKWTAPLGTQTYGTPIVANGRVYIATKGKADDKKYPNRAPNERGEILCLDEKTGALIWRCNEARMTSYGITTAPVVEGNRVYLYGYRADLLCLDADGLANGNDGPFINEADLYGKQQKAPAAPVELDAADADVIWSFSVKEKFSIFPHNAYAYAPLVDGNYVYASTGNSANERFAKPMTPEAPSLMVVDKRTGELVAVDNEKMGRTVIHGQWGTPCIGDVNGKPQLLYPGGDGLLYGFDLMPEKLPDGSGVLKKIWSFDPNLHSAPKTDHCAAFGAPVCYKNRAYSALSDDWSLQIKQGLLVCVDATKTGDITHSGLVWKNDSISTSVSTVSISSGLVYLADLSGQVHCIDAETGKTVWSFDSGAQIWQSTLVADGKIYFGNCRGNFFILKEGRTLSVIFQTKLHGEMSGACTAANGTLYVAAGRTLYAIASMKSEK